ncbi:MAG: branched-chain amino acid transport system substrate-binding protein [Blastocatellia bacterium]|nr:branched-chain amino acid transport system substrate-binding protein [Blastocatellia bacterium]
MILAQSGSSSYFGVTTLNGIQLAEIQLNAASGRRFQIQLIVRDDQARPELAAQHAVALIRDEHVHVLLAAGNSDCSHAVMDVVRKYEIPQVTPLSAASILTTLGNPWFNRVAISDRQSVSALMRYLSRKKLRRTVVLYENTEWGRGLVADTQQAIRAEPGGVELLDAVPIQRDDVSGYPAAVSRALSAKPDAVGIYLLQKDAIGIVKQIHSVRSDVSLFTTPANSSQDFLDVAGDSADGLITLNSFFPDGPSTRALEFTAAYRERYRQNPTNFSAQGYDALRVVYEAAVRVGYDNPTKLRDAIRATNFAGAIGAISFDANGELASPDLKLVVANGGRFVPEGLITTKEARTSTLYLKIIGTLLPVLYLVALFPLVWAYPRSHVARSAVNSGIFTKFPILHKLILNSTWARRKIFREHLLASSKVKSDLVHYVDQRLIPVGTATAEDVHTVTQSTSPTPLSLFTNSRIVLIRGRSGTGKTVLLNTLLRAAAHNTIRHRKAVCIPLLIDLRRHPIQDHGDFTDMIVDDLMGSGVELSKEVLDFLLDKGNFLILIDSLSEVDSAALVKLMMPFLNRRRNVLVALAIQVDPFNRRDTKIYELDEIKPEQAREYITKAIGRDLWKDLSPAIRSLTANPQDLAVLCQVLKSADPAMLQQARAELYRALLHSDSTLGEWARNSSPEISAIYNWAHYAVMEHLRPQAEEEVSQRLSVYRSEVDDEFKVDDVIRAMRTSKLFSTIPQRTALGLSADLLTFRHELIGLFLASRHIRHQLEFERPISVETMLTGLNAERWLEVFVFLVDELDSLPLLNQVFECALALESEYGARLAAYMINSKPALAANVTSVSRYTQMRLALDAKRFKRTQQLKEENVLEQTETGDMREVQSVQEAYDQGALGYHAYWPRRHDFIEPERIEFVGLLPKNGRVLDVGCGPGQDSEYFASLGLQVVGIDLSDQLLTIASERVPTANFEKADMRNLTFPSQHFDGIWASFSFLHIPSEEAEATMRGLLRVVKPGGPVFLAIHTSERTNARVAPIAGLSDEERQQVSTFVQEWAQDDFRRLLTNVGLKIVTFRPFTRPGGAYPLLSTLSINPQAV